MCLVVMYGINKNADENLIEKMIYMNYDVKPLVNEYVLHGEGLENYNFYSVGVCNCDSYICGLSNTNCDNFKDFYLQQKDIYEKRKLAVENLRKDPKYEKLTSKFKKEYDKQRKLMQKYSVSDTKKMADFQKFLVNNSVFIDDMGGLIATETSKYCGDIDQLIQSNILNLYEKDTNIIDGALTIADDIVIVPVWTDGSLEYNVKCSDIGYADINENVLGKLNYNTGYKIH